MEEYDTRVETYIEVDFDDSADLPIL